MFVPSLSWQNDRLYINICIAQKWRFSQSFTNDLEPTALAECGGYQHKDDAGQLPVCDTGWGFFNLNLLAATLQAYRDSIAKATAPTTVLRISKPSAPATVVSPSSLVRESMLRVSWASVGSATKFHLVIDAGLLATTVTHGCHDGVCHGDNSTETSVLLDLSTVPDGNHTVTITALDGHSAFSLARDTLDAAHATAAQTQAVDSVPFTLQKPTTSAQSVPSKAVGFVNQPEQTSYECLLRGICYRICQCMQRL